MMQLRMAVASISMYRQSLVPALRLRVERVVVVWKSLRINDYRGSEAAKNLAPSSRLAQAQVL